MRIPLWPAGLIVCVALVGAARSTDSFAEVASITDDAHTSTEGSAADTNPLLAFAACMRENGLDDFEDPIVGPEGAVEFPNKAESKSEDDFKAAFDVCGALLEGTVLGTAKTGADTVEAVDSLVGFARCVRAAGFDMPDPDASGQFPEFNKESPKFDAAYEQCADEIAGGKESK
jgi:hypothetical protein